MSSSAAAAPLLRVRGSDRCAACWLPPRLCLCDRLPVVPCGFRLTIIRHVKESLRSSNTARIAALCIPGARILEFGDPARPLPADLLAGPGAAALFPPEPGGPPLPRPLRELFVIDGTWAQARRMSHRIPGLAALPRLSVAPPEPGVMRLREAHADWAMGTMEAIAAAVRAEGDPAGALALERAHALFVHRSFSLRRAMPDEPPEEPPEEPLIP